MTTGHNDLRSTLCTFCDTNQPKSDVLMSRNSQAGVCFSCVRALAEIVFEEDTHPPPAPLRQRPPSEIYANLDAHVIGQERAKKTLSVAVYNHYKRVLNGVHSDSVDIQKANILLVGPTGCGKTLLAETLARSLDIPFAICDATSLTESGYVGEDVENVLLRLIQAADWDVRRAEHGIIYIDEIDKVARKEGVNRSITRDVSGEGVQQELLKIIEGCVANVPPQGGRKHPHQEFLQIDTTNILFICGGSFDGLGHAERHTNGNGSRLGFLAGTRAEDSADDHYCTVTPDELLEYGLIPELVGRLPLTVTLESLDKDDLVRVLTEPKNAIVKQYQQLFKMDGVDLEFTTGALEATAEETLQHRTGARYLRYVIEHALLDTMYHLPSMHDCTRCVVERDTIAGQGSPRLLGAAGDDIALPTQPVRKTA